MQVVQAGATIAQYAYANALDLHNDLIAQYLADDVEIEVVDASRENLIQLRRTLN